MSDAVLREMYERSRDIIRVKNPLSVDFRFKWDSVWYRVPAHGEKDFERYLANQYFMKLSAHIIGQMAMEKGEKMLVERKERGLSDFLNKYDENRAVWDNTPRTDNRELMERLAGEIIVGLVEKFNSEPVPKDELKPEDKTLSTAEQVMNDFANRKVEEPLPPKPIIQPMKTKRVTAAEVTQ